MINDARYYRDNITLIGKQMDHERYLKNKGKNQNNYLFNWWDTVLLNMLDEVMLPEPFEEKLSFQNLSADTGHCVEINRPDVYGFYKTTYPTSKNPLGYIDPNHNYRGLWDDDRWRAYWYDDLPELSRKAKNDAMDDYLDSVPDDYIKDTPDDDLEGVLSEPLTLNSLALFRLQLDSLDSQIKEAINKNKEGDA